jgi:hypothetical protein
MELDAAIREAAGQMEANLPGQTKVALVSFASSSSPLSEYVINRLEAALVGGKKLVVVDRANLDRIREEQGFQLSGEVSDESAKAIGKLLGAGAIVTGAFTDLGDVYSLALKAINMETAAIAVSYPADIAKSTRITTLLAAGGAGTQAGNRSGGTAARAPAAPAAPPAQVYHVGETGPAGGWIFFDKGFYAEGWRYLEAAPQDYSTKVQWGAKATVGVSTRSGMGSGKINTELVASALKRSGETMTAAQVADAVEYNGYGDWFLPSMDELNLMYENLKLQGIGKFSSEWYWSSTENSAGASRWWADGMDFSNGRSLMLEKNTSAWVRVCRQF